MIITDRGFNQNNLPFLDIKVFFCDVGYSIIMSIIMTNLKRV